MAERHVITDLGENVPIFKGLVAAFTKFMTLPRYGVWLVEGTRLCNVVETSDDLEYLKNKYNLTEVYYVGSDIPPRRRKGAGQ